MCKRLSVNEYKQKLEHKIYLAQESPSRIYDLVDCNITQIPQGVFTFCKVLRKYSLDLSDNNIYSLESGGNLEDLFLLGELVLTKNKIKSLPSNFSRLCNLKKLITNDNKLQKFPIVLIDLKYLEILDLEGNSITNIPKEVGRFKSLKTFKMSRNPIKTLCSEICEIETLKEFTIDIINIKNVPPDILFQGIDVVWRFFCKEKNVKYRNINVNTSSLHGFAMTSENNTKFCGDTGNFSYSSQQNALSRRNQEIDKEVLEHEKTLSMIELANKQKNIDQIKRESALEDEAIKAILLQKKYDTDRLFDKIKYEELSSKELIDNIFEYNNKSKKREELEFKMMFQSNFDYQTFDNNTKISDDEKFGVLDSMKDVLQRATDSFLARQSINDKYFSDVQYSGSISNYQSFREIDALQENERQKLAFQQFQLEKDPQMKRLGESIHLIELKVKQLSNNQSSSLDQGSLSKLTSLLKSLESEKTARRYELDQIIENMDMNRDKCENDFWIVQYQKLLDEKAKSDYEIEQFLKLANFESWISIFKENDYTFDMLINLSEEDLAKMNVGYEWERKKFLIFLNEWKFNPVKSNVKPEPSAPLEHSTFLKEITDPAIPSAPRLENSLSRSNETEDNPVLLARKEIECCICLNYEATILMLNCGHVCCCQSCSLTVKECPLCREKIVKRVNLEFRI